ncbi:MAG TPA: hydrogenase/urease maturation nickel metallochaperone HypA [Solirubrobacteraceae bacterium]|nr:hydrogenase/urease maturation nickel metallochaperone HypA [Solirubrobacteraceae bacterium]
MHERALMADVTRKIEQTALEAGGGRVTRVVVVLGALSHFTAEHFREHFADATSGTVAEGAEVIATVDDDLSAPHAGDVVLESVELEFAGTQEQL